MTTSLRPPARPRPPVGPDRWGRAAWAASFLGFPVGGLVAIGVVGHVDSPFAALVGGAVTGVAIGAAQVLASRAMLDRARRLPPVGWIATTASGVAVGLALGASTVGFATSLGALALQGAITGAVVGPLQALALPSTSGTRRWWWAAAGPALFAAGWTITTLAGIGVDAQFTTFGATGALAYTVLAGLLLRVVVPRSARS